MSRHWILRLLSSLMYLFFFFYISFSFTFHYSLQHTITFRCNYSCVSWWYFPFITCTTVFLCWLHFFCHSVAALVLFIHFCMYIFRMKQNEHKNKNQTGTFTVIVMWENWKTLGDDLKWIHIVGDTPTYISTLRMFTHIWQNAYILIVVSVWWKQVKNAAIKM